MYDLNLLNRDHKFSIHEGPPRIALIHHGFRTTQLSLKDNRSKRFTPRFPSLGLLNLARSLQVDYKKKLIVHEPEIRYFDEDWFGNDEELASAVAEWLHPATARFLLVGLYSLAVDRTSGFLAKLDPEKFCIVVGGAHPTVAPMIDYAHIVVRGEGGAAMRHILNTLLEPAFGEGSDARGICFKLNGLEKMSKQAFDNSLSKIPAPAFAYELSQSRTDLSDRPQVRWWKSVGKSPQIYICTQSCRARCTFCSTYLIHGRLVSRPVELVKADLKYIAETFGHDSIEFHDDDLLQHDEFDDLMVVLHQSGLTWTCNARSEYMTPNRAKQMYDAGCRKVFLGVESFNQTSLDYYRKQTTVEMNISAVKALDSAGIGVVGGFIFGAPHDTLKSSLAEIDTILELPIYFLSASILTPDIGTTEFMRAMKKLPEIRFLGDNGTKMNVKPRPEIFGSKPPYGLPTVCDYLSKDELNEIYELACCEFFLRKSAHSRIIKLTPNSRLKEVSDWYIWTNERASNLLASAQLDAVKQRTERLISRDSLHKSEFMVS